MTDGKEAKMRTQWPHVRSIGELVSVRRPCTVIDAGGKILAWIVPEGFSPERQVGPAVEFLTFEADFTGRPRSSRVLWP